MSETKHTPGTWVADGLEVKVEDDGWVLAEVIDTNDEGAANARLIAAAPELLDVLERIVRYQLIPDHWTTAETARAVIAKATGTEEEA